jgi:hypothetical protein
MSAYTCPGLSMPQPADAPEEGYVACYVAGHECVTESVREEDEHGVLSEIRCRCCGDPHGSMYVPKGMEA